MTLVVGLVVGYLDSIIQKGKEFGIPGDMVIGILGAVFGSWLFGLLGLTTYGLVGNLIMTVVTAFLFLFLLGRLVHR
jgi:uncharacterized membrane protein YeaQ/YmgE (transglycosylase-associated protein family)